MVAVVASSALPERLVGYHTAYRPQTFASRNLRSKNFVAKTLLSQELVAHNHETPSLNNPYFIDPYDHHVRNFFADAELDRSETVMFVGSGLTTLMKASLDHTNGSGKQEFKDVSKAMVAAVRHILETRVANGKYVSEEQFENLRGVETKLADLLEDSIKPTYNRHEAFLGQSARKIFGNAELDRSEAVVLVGSGLAALMKASLEHTYDSRMQNFNNASMAMIAAVRHILETRIANGRHVSEEQFKNLRGVEERLSAILDVITAIFDENDDTVYSLPNFFKEFNFDPVERSKLIARIVPSISKMVFQATEDSTAEYFRDTYNVFLPAIREFMEDRVANGKPVTQDQFDRLERAEKLIPPLMQAFVTVVHDQFLVDFMQKLQLDPTERAKYHVTGFFASIDTIFKDTNASVDNIIRDVMLAYMPSSRQVFEDRLAQGKPVTQENFDNLERMEKTLPNILDTYVKMVNDLDMH